MYYIARGSVCACIHPSVCVCGTVSSHLYALSGPQIKRERMGNITGTCSASFSHRWDEMPEVATYRTFFCWAFSDQCLRRNIAHRAREAMVKGTCSDLWLTGNSNSS